MGFDPTFGAAGASHRGGSVPDPGSALLPGKFLSAAGDWEYPYAFSAELAGGAATIDFTSIPATARHLRFACLVRSASVAGGGPVAWSIRLNGSLGSTYSALAVQVSSGADLPSVAYTGVGGWLLDDITTDSPTFRPTGLPALVDAERMTFAVVDIPYYAASSPQLNRYMSATVAGLVDSAGNEAGMHITGRCSDTAATSVAINRVTFHIASGNFHANSVIQMIGLS